jgi:glutathione S-transferase
MEELVYWLHPKIGNYIKYDPDKEKSSIEEVRVILTALEWQLSRTPYLVGDKIR